MPEFLELRSRIEALEKLLDNIPSAGTGIPESVLTENALGRVLARPVLSKEPLPPFSRSSVDGYAVWAEDTYGAGESLPMYLELVGEIPMGKTTDIALDRGQCVLIHTGGMLPQKANAVVMIEDTQLLQSNEVEISRAVAIGENVIQAGEDVTPGQVVMEAGIKLRPAEIGGLMALGITEVQVFRLPKVGILSSGDELVPPASGLQPGQVRDINSYSLSCLVKQVGGLPSLYPIVPDQIEALQAAAEIALRENDVLLITAGSSASVRDYTSTVIAKLGSPGVLVHGVNIRPGKPTILAVCDGKPVIGLPGNPVSALVIALFFVKPVLEHVMGLRKKPLEARVKASLAINLPSRSGQEEWVPVRLEPGVDGYQAVPVFGRSNLIFSLVRADGLVGLHPDANGIAAGEIVEVLLF